jgi:hypothetical protein
MEFQQNLQPQLTSRRHAKAVSMRAAAVEKPVSLASVVWYQSCGLVSTLGTY